MNNLSERVAVAEQRIADHEARCEERLGEIKATAASTLKAVESLKTRMFGVVLALMAWALAQVWATATARPHHTEAHRPATAQAAAR